MAKSGLTSEQTCWNDSLPSRHPLAVYCVSSNMGPARVLAVRPCEKGGISIPCQSRQAKEMPPTEGESGPIGRHPQYVIPWVCLALPGLDSIRCLRPEGGPAHYHARVQKEFLHRGWERTGFLWYSHSHLDGSTEIDGIRSVQSFIMATLLARSSFTSATGVGFKDRH